MKEANFRLVQLFDCYAPLLTDKQRECFDLYYNQDFSLSEIAEECGISRQGVHDTLQRTESALQELEDKLGTAAREEQLQAVAARLAPIAELLRVSAPDAFRELQSVIDLLEKE